MVDRYNTEMGRAEAAYKAAELAMQTAQNEANEKEGEIDSLTTDLSNFDMVYQADSVAMEARRNDHQEALEATREAIAIMQRLLDDPEGGAELLQMPQSDMLVQIKALTDAALASGADQGAVAKIIGMLEDVAANLEASIAHEGTQEGLGTDHYQAVKAEMERTLRDLQDALDHLLNVISEQQAIYNTEFAAYEEAKRLWQDATGKLEAKRAECNLWEQEYNNNKQKRSEEREIIAQVVVIFQDYPESEFAAYFDARQQE